MPRAPFLNVTNIPASRVPLLDPKTGGPAPEWYRWFQNLFMLTGGGGSAISIEDTIKGFPVADLSGELAQVYDQAQLASLFPTRTAESASRGVETDILPSPPQLGTISWQNYDNVKITGGAIDGTPIGATTRATGAFTTLTLTNPLTVPNGGTGVATLASNGVLYGNGAGVVQATAAGTTGQVLTATTGAAPSWSALSGLAVTSLSFGTTGLTPSAATQGAVTVAGTLITSNGGTGLSSWTAGDLPYFASGTALSKLGIGTSTYLLTSSGTAPQWSNPTGVTVGTATNLASGAANRIAYQSGAGATTFVVAPTIANTFLEWSGSAFQWTANPLGTVTSVAQSFTGGLISVAGSPITTSGTLALTVAGTSGGVPYFSSASTWASSAALTANALVIGGGAGAAPSTTSTAAGILTFLGTPSSANLAAAVTDEVGTGSLTFQTATTWTPTVTASSGTITTSTVNSATYTRTGNLVFATADISISNAGTGAGSLNITLPFTNGSTVCVGAGRENSLTGFMLQGTVNAGSNSMAVRDYANNTPIATGARVYISITFAV